MPGNRCFLCEGWHLADECTTYRTLKERENAVETRKLCLQCLQPTADDHVHLRPACKHCGKTHHQALCPLEPWRRGTTCAFCLGYHHSHACDKYTRISDKVRAAEDLKICRRCLSRSHLEDCCTSMHRCKKCKERHHYLLCPNAVSDDADDIEVIRVVQGSKSMPLSKESSKKTKQSSSPLRRQKQADKLKAQASEARRDLRLAKEAKRRAERERDHPRNERDDTQNKFKALEMKVHDLEEENRNCEAIRQVTAAVVEASIEIVTNREEERRRAIEQERDDAKKKLLEAEMRIEALKEAASGAVRLTLEFQAWRIRAAIKAKKGGMSQKELSKNEEDGSACSGKVVTTDQKTVNADAGEAAQGNARKRASAPADPGEKRRKMDSNKPSADEISRKLDGVLGGLSVPITEKYKLFFAENLRGSVTIDELVEFVKLRCPNDVGLANSVLSNFTTP